MVHHDVQLISGYVSVWLKARQGERRDMGFVGRKGWEIERTIGEGSSCPACLRSRYTLGLIRCGRGELNRTDTSVCRLPRGEGTYVDRIVYTVLARIGASVYFAMR